jgi:hypothetical protein
VSGSGSKTGVGGGGDGDDGGGGSGSCAGTTRPSNGSSGRDVYTSDSTHPASTTTARGGYYWASDLSLLAVYKVLAVSPTPCCGCSRSAVGICICCCLETSMRVAKACCCIETA